MSTTRRVASCPYLMLGNAMAAVRNVLIVEDEPLIAMMLENFLEALDHGLAGSAETVEEALGIVAQGGVDIAVLDLNLRGGKTSAPVAEELARRSIPFVVASGGGVDEMPLVFQGRPKLSKPFTIAGMEQALNAL